LEIIREIYVFYKVEDGQDSKAKVEARGAFDYNFFKYLFCFFCQKEQRKMWTLAIQQKDKELDLLNIIDTARKGNFLKKMQVEPDKVTLAKYSREYRIIA